MQKMLQQHTEKALQVPGVETGEEVRIDVLSEMMTEQVSEHE